MKASTVSSAWLVLLGDKEIIFSESGLSYLMYARSGGSLIALGEPIGSTTESRELVWELRERADQEALHPVFYQVGAQHLSLFVDIGLLLFKLGEEARVTLANFSLDGRDHSGQRQALRRAEREGFKFRVMTCEEVGARIGELRAISDDWLSRKNAKEKKFSLGFFSEDYIRRTSVAVVEREGILVAFANLWLPDPREEFSVDLMRYGEGAPKGVMDFLFTHLMLWGKEAGYLTLNLGMAPLSGLETHALAPVWHKLGTFLYRHGEHFYNFQGLRSYKEKFNPEWIPKYVAAPGGLALPAAMKDVASLISGGLKGVFFK